MPWLPQWLKAIKKTPIDREARTLRIAHTFGQKEVFYLMASRLVRNLAVNEHGQSLLAIENDNWPSDLFPDGVLGTCRATYIII